MIADNILLQPLGINSLFLVFKIGFISFAVLYFIFTLIVLRQVNLMTDTVITEGAPILKALAILYAGLALGVIVLFIGLL